jgi:hypothetical protein
MNLTRHSIKEDVPTRCENLRWLYTRGNEFSDEKSATIAINAMVAKGTPLYTICVSVYPTFHNPAICFYIATP